jgi:hypothetical protein
MNYAKFASRLSGIRMGLSVMLLAGSCILAGTVPAQTNSFARKHAVQRASVKVLRGKVN